MKTTKMIVLVLLVTISTKVFSQTKIIAHKSHSGKMKTFSVKEEGNFGNPPMFRDSIIKISETMLVEVWKFPYYRDTIKIKDCSYF